jgi:hypothetical protein
MKIVDVNLANQEEAMVSIKEALALPEFAGKETRLYITKHNKTFRGQPTKTEYTAPATIPEPVKEKPAKKSHHNPAKGY